MPGSGLGTYILGLLEEHFPEVYRFTSCIFPSEDDDVITSPYNSVLALRELTEHADCVLPIENEALMDMCAKMDKAAASSGVQFSSLADTGLSSSPAASAAIVKGSRLSDSIDLRELEHLYMKAGGGTKRAVPAQPSKKRAATNTTTTAAKPKSKASQATSAFGEMNNIVARLLTNLTSSMRFEGSLNVDLNEITTNLVPFPKLKFLLSSMSPMFATADPRQQPRRLAQMFSDAFQK